MAQFMISAAHKSSGKTTISVGLCAAFRARGLRLQPFKKGPDYIDPLWLSAAAQRSCCNLDFYTQDTSEILEIYGTAAASADVCIVEGNKGLYDGLDLDGSNSNAALARLLATPVVLVLDTRGMTRGVAPLILGYQAFDPEIQIAGVILNHIGGARHDGKLRRVIEHYTEVRVIGAVPHNPGLQIEERHLGLIPQNERGDGLQLIESLGAATVEYVDLDALLELAGENTPPAHLGSGTRPAGPGRSADVRIGFANDQAFGFYYPGDLRAMAEAGAELVAFDTLNDRTLPAVDGLWLGGGFPEARMRELEANEAMRAAIRQFIEAGGPAYAECGGLMYLARNLTWKGERCNMVGVLPADVVMHERPQGRGYVRLRGTANHPWADMTSVEVAAHEFHYSALAGLSSHLDFGYGVERGFGIDGRNDGIIYKNLLANYSHMRDTGQNRWTHRFVAFVRARRSVKGGQ